MPVSYLLLLLLLFIWAVLALRGQRLRQYSPVYFIGHSMAYTAEFLLSGVFQLYQYHSGWMADPFRDERLMATLVMLGIDPLIVLLYARYCRPHPYLAAVITAAGVSLLEALFLLTGAMQYPHNQWSPLITFALSIPAFLFIWRLVAGKIPIPDWWHIWAMAFWLTMPMDTLLSGALGLWRYRLPFVDGDLRAVSRMVGFVYNSAVQAPVATLVCIGPWRRRWLAGIAGIGGLLGLEAIGLATGVMRYANWSLWLSLVNYTITIFGPLLYTIWYRKGDRPAPWVAPGRHGS